MTHEPNDFAPEPAAAPEPAQGNTALKIGLIVGGLGCGCLGLLGVGLIAAIALPSFLSSANRARESEARLKVASLARAQQAYFLERGEFATTPEPLGLSLPLEGEHYHYRLETAEEGVTVRAVPQIEGLRGYVSGVFAMGTPGDSITITGLCETETPTVEPPPAPTWEPGEPPQVLCGPGTRGR